MTSAWQTLDVSVRGPVGWLRFNRPERRNGVTATMAVEMYGALTELAAIEELSVLVLTGVGDTFCPGADLRHAAEDPESASRLPDAVTYHSARLLHEIPAVTVAAINGACAGAGLAWAAACDLRVASSAARFATAFLDVGLPGELGLAWTLPRLVGPAKARELMLRPRKITADEALAIGFVSEVWPAPSFAEELARLVDEFASRPPATLRAMKSSFIEAEQLGLADYIDAEAVRYLALFTGDGAERIRNQVASRGEQLRA